MRFSAGWLLAGAVVFGVSGCSNGDDDEAPKPPTLTLASSSISKTVTIDDEASFSELAIALSDFDASKTRYQVEWTGNAVASATVVPSGASQATLKVLYPEPSSLGIGTYAATVKMRFCYDEFCQTEFAGSPATVSVSYTITENSVVPSLSLATDTVSATAVAGAQADAVSVALTISELRPNAPPVSINITSEGSALVSANYYPYDARSGAVQIGFQARPEGTYTSVVTVTACLDFSCTRPLAGSPKQINVTHTVTPVPPIPPDRETLPTTSVKALPHDVLDAEFSGALNSVVMISSYPDNALYLYNVTDGTEQKLALDRPGTAVAVSRDGLTAAVAHNTLVTHVSLQQLATPLTAVRLLNTGANVSELVVDGGKVHVLAASNYLASIDVATNTEAVNYSGYYFYYTRPTAQLLPDGTAFYVAESSNLARFNISAGVAAYAYSGSTYPSDPCGNVWMSEEGLHLYTACGNVFRSSASPSVDMSFSGSIPLSTAEYNNSYRIVSLSQSAEAKQIALVETDSSCQQQYPQPSTPCSNHYNLYESVYFARTASYFIPSIEVAGRFYAQRGLYSFHSADGNTRVLLSKLFAMPDPTKEYYLSVLR